MAQHKFGFVALKSHTLQELTDELNKARNDFTSIEVVSCERDYQEEEECFFYDVLYKGEWK